MVPVQVGKSLDQGKVDSLVRTMATLQLSEAAGEVDDEAQGFASPAATVTLAWEGGEARVQVGTTVEGKDSQRYITREGFGFAGTIWDSSIKRFLDDGLAALIDESAGLATSEAAEPS